MNKVELKGRLVKNVEFKEQPTYKIAKFTLAVENDYTNSQGKKDTYFIDCVAWGDVAQWFATDTGKGDLVYVFGSIQTRSYEAQDGQKRKVFEINVKSANGVRKAGQPHVSQFANAGDLVDKIKYTAPPTTPSKPDEYDPFNE